MSITDSFDTEVRVALLDFFIEHGRAPVAAEIAWRLDSSAPAVEESFRRLHEAHVLVLAPGSPYIWMANPMSALPTPYRVECRGKTFWANCVWDALGIPAMLGDDGVVRCSCPDCAEELHLEVVSDELIPSEQVVHYSVPARQWWDDIGYT